jgi:hypothetical protein
MPEDVEYLPIKIESMKRRKKLSINFLGWLALLVGIGGAIISLYFMFNAGRDQPSVFLIILFTLWVLSPFIGLFVLNNISKRWIVSVRETLYWLAIITTILSVAGYSGRFNTPDTKTAFVFLVIPFVSWIIIAISFFIARRVSKRSRSH